MASQPRSNAALIDLQRLLERGRDLFGRLAAGLSQVGPASPAAAHDRRDFLEPVAGVQAPFDQVFRQPGDELNLAVGRRDQQDGQTGLAAYGARRRSTAASRQATRFRPA